MASSLVIVESPAKAKTINKYLGKDFQVTSSLGHVIDLPSGTLGINIEENFKPEYTVIKGKKKVLTEIKKAVKDKQRVYLAPDPDREGEAIAWHIANEINSKKLEIYRVTFNEITKEAIKEAFKHPGQIDLQKVNAQQARRILDRLVGYMISPLLWRKLFTGLSAGRVQSVALKMICDREAEIKAFVKEEYWSVTADLLTSAKASFKAKLRQYNGKNITISDADTAERVVEELKKLPYVVDTIKKQEKRRHPYAPFITSTLQQEAARHFNFSANKTMMVAQNLYEGIEIGSEGITGLITYMRTDSTRIAQSAINDARSFIAKDFGNDYVPAKPNIYSTKKMAQDAHEAVRPTVPSRTPDQIKQYLTSDQYKLYSLIWKRFIASQMKSAVLSQTTIDITAGAYSLRVTGSIIIFDGFMKLYMEKSDKDTSDDDSEDKEGFLPDMKEHEMLTLKKLTPKQHFTQPPPRYSEATLIKALEENGIGRPSTYAAIMSRIQDKQYTQKIKGKFHPTELGVIVTTALTESFTGIINEKFTAQMESELDDVENGTKDWVELLKGFYEKFNSNLEKAAKEMKITPVPTDIACEKCGKHMVVRWSKNGGFLSCSGYPDCKHTSNYTKDAEGIIVPAEQPKVLEETCPECEKPLVKRQGRYGEFLACSGYPQCRYTRPINQSAEEAVKEKSPVKLTEEKCPKCNAQLAERTGKYGSFLACSKYPKCRYIKPEETAVRCPQDGCDGSLIKRKGRRGKPFYGCSNYPDCKFTVQSLEELENKNSGNES
ncbi:MAG: type I DNA topoisomerase [Candidatus Auribacterota bacterium]|jgi:DNA topoisomerase-1|nr:type I DNA topoisomerase [Candidatus Auribacterota bacterium]